MRVLNHGRARVVLGVIAVGALIALPACAPATEPSSSSSPTPEASSPEPYAGPVAFIGDELSWVLPATEDIVALIPSATEVSAPSRRAGADLGWWWARILPGDLWRLLHGAESGGTGNPDGVMVAAERHRVHGQQCHCDAVRERGAGHCANGPDRAAAQQCDAFDYDGPNTFDAVIAEEEDGARAVAGTLNGDPSAAGWRSFHGYAAVGNTLVHLMSSLPEDEIIDAAAAAAMLQGAAVKGKTELIEYLTSTPPADPTEPEGDASVPWSEWTITGLGVGPIRFGDTYDDVVAALPDADVTRPGLRRKRLDFPELGRRVVSRSSGRRRRDDLRDHGGCDVR